ncbi:MAG: type II toxin-antitoxin system HicB family antitoxin [Arcicella sp.]|jgi:predicted RNase H-like HicB family nuclease|nr:type II toxin-antitoxin system HicB family antitoxin [Arcicella sp.]
MNNRTYRVVISKDEDGIYVADIPTLKHCVSYGSTIEEAMQNIQEALEGVLLVMEEEGLQIPDDSNVVEYSINVPTPLFSRSASNFVTA